MGVLTTQPIKYAAMELVNIMLRERRICVCKHIHSRDKKALLIRLREQLQVYAHTQSLLILSIDVLICVLFLQVYSFQFKAAITTFQQDRTALSGKVGGMRDDLVIALQLGCYWTSVGVLEKRALGGVA